MFLHKYHTHVPTTDPNISAPPPQVLSMSSLKHKAADLSASAAKKPKADKSITSFFSVPSSSPPDSTAGPQPSSSATALPKFDKEKWVAKLTPEQRELLSLEIQTLHESWLAQLKEEVVSKDFLDLKRFLKEEKAAGKQIFPPEREIYSWLVFISYLFLQGGL